MNKIKTFKPKLLWKIRCTLGEGTLWVNEHNSIYFVDIKKKKIYSLNIKNKNKKIFKVNKEIGFIAQEVEPHFPSLISESEDERYDYKVKAIGYSTFGVIATGAVKELKLEKDSEIASLKDENNKLRDELESLKKEMNDRLDLFEKTLSKITDGK